MTTPHHAADRAPSHDPGALYVDLDGTLIAGDTLWESLGRLVRERPLALLGAPRWLAGGKAWFKARVAERVVLDPRTLPYRREVLDYIAGERERGREIILASASNDRICESIASHLGLFDAVISSDESTNRAGRGKLEAIQARQSGAGFEYMGNSGVDLPIFEAAEVATLVDPTRAARAGMAASGRAHTVLVEPRPVLPEALRELRPHQWAKNALIFVPLLLAHEFSDLARSFATAIACVGFCAVASAGYLLNDLLDVEADRRHPSKRKRPLAAGTVSIPLAFAMTLCLLAFAFGSSWLLLRPASTAMLAAYLGLTLSYSFYFKQRLFIDVLMLAGLYTHRVLAGAVAAEVPVSPWLLAFSTFFFLSLALVKRYIELQGARDRDRDAIDRRAYRVDDLGLVETSGIACAYISVLVLCLFVSSEAVTRLYRTPELLWLMCPVMLYWITRIWFLARRGELDDDPVLFATRDRASYVAGGLVGAIVAAAAL